MINISLNFPSTRQSSISVTTGTDVGVHRLLLFGVGGVADCLFLFEDIEVELDWMSPSAAVVNTALTMGVECCGNCDGVSFDGVSLSKIINNIIKLSHTISV